MLLIFIVALPFLLHIAVKVYLKLTCGKCKSNVCLVGKTVLITGGNQGIGFQTALALAARGCRLIIADKNCCEETKQTIIKQTRNTNIIIKKFDLSSLNSVRALAKDILETESRLDVLINNAGHAYLDDVSTEDGLNLSMQVNHFGPFLLTNLLLGLMKKSSPSRIIFVASDAAFYADIAIAQLNRPKPTPFNAYSCAKLCTMATVPEFVKRLSGTGVTVNCLHPGIVDNPLITSASSKIPRYLYTKCLYWLYSKTPEEGAQTSIYLAMSNDVENTTGEYFADCRKKPMPKLAKCQKFSQTVWEVSEQLVKL